MWLADSILLSSRARTAPPMVYDRRSALSRALYAGAKVLFCPATRLGSVGSFSSCPVLVAHQLSASEERPRVLTGSGGRSGVAWDQAARAAMGRRLVAAFFVGRGGALSVAA